MLDKVVVNYIGQLSGEGYHKVMQYFIAWVIQYEIALRILYESIFCIIFYENTSNLNASRRLWFLSP